MVLARTPGWSRSVSRSFRMAWAFFPLACVVGLFLVDSFLPSWPGGEWVIDLALIVVLAALWYFVIGRITAHRRLREVREQFSAPVTSYCVRSPRGGFGWLAPFRDPDSDGQGLAPFSVTAMIAGAADLQFWGRAAEGSGPVAVVPWSSVEQIAGAGGATLAIRLRVHGSTERGEIRFMVLSDRWFSRSVLRGRELQRLIDRLDGFRQSRSEDEKTAHGA